MKKIIVYGLGKIFHNRVKDDFIWWSKKYEIIAFCDTAYSEKNMYIDNVSYPIIKPYELTKYSFDMIMITSTKFFDEICEELKQYGIQEEQIKSIYDILWRNYIDFEELDTIKCVDIGGPSSIFRDIYDKVDLVDIVNFSTVNEWNKQGLGNVFEYKEKKGSVIINDATDLEGIEDNSYDLVLSSNNLEHIANPLKALLEWKRILKRNGRLVVVVPNKKKCFDHNRDDVTFKHLLDDYNNEVTEADLTHLDEILEKHDLSMDEQAGTYEEFKNRSLYNFENRCLHHHVFNEEVLMKIGVFLEMNVCGISSNKGIDYIVSYKKN